MLRAIEFFAGSGLVRLGLGSCFQTVWASDFCKKKKDVYVANHGNLVFHAADIREIDGRTIPAAELAWASFPCQDLSLAGNLLGMGQGTRSGLFWDWIRILWEMREVGTLPPVLIAENVTGFLVADGSRHFVEAYKALRELGYLVGGLVLNASDFLPQSRPRAFLVAVRDGIDLSGLTQSHHEGSFHTATLVRASNVVNDPGFLWWRLPESGVRVPEFSELCERDAPFDDLDKTDRLLNMLSPLHKRRIESFLETNSFFAGTAYRRTRPDIKGKGRQFLEVRFDGLAGCLRTPNGGSSRQIVVIAEHEAIRTRLMTIRECARLMGAPDSYQLPGSYNDAYRAMGDGVAAPVTAWLTRHLLRPLAERAVGITSGVAENTTAELDNYYPLLNTTGRHAVEWNA